MKKFIGLLVSLFGIVFWIVSNTLVGNEISKWEQKLSQYYGAEQSYFASFYYDGPNLSEINKNLSSLNVTKMIMIILSVVIIVVGIIIFIKHNNLLLRNIAPKTSSDGSAFSFSEKNAVAWSDKTKKVVTKSKETLNDVRKYGKATIDVIKDKAIENEIKTHCPKCGAKIKSKQNFCPVCGISLIQKTEPNSKDRTDEVNASENTQTDNSLI